MTTTSINDATKTEILDWLWNDVAPTAAAGRWLGLATDASLTEVTDGAYARYDLDAVMAAPASGSISNDVAISANVGAQTATYWFVHDATSGSGTLGKMVSGQLSESFTGAKTIPIGAIEFALTGSSMTINTATITEVLDWIFNDVAPTAGTGRWLGFATDSSLTEIGSANRYDLDAAMGAPASGAITNTGAINADAGGDTATHWFMIDHATTAGTLGKMCSGALTDGTGTATSFTSTTTIAIGAIDHDLLGA